MKNPIFNRIIALVLPVLTVFYLLPASVYAEICSEATAKATVNTNDGTGNYYTYDGLGRTTEGVTAGEYSLSVEYSYDELDRLHSVLDILSPLW